MRAFEFHDARKNCDPEGGGGSILASFQLEGPTDSVHAVINKQAADVRAGRGERGGRRCGDARRLFVL